MAGTALQSWRDHHSGIERASGRGLVETKVSPSHFRVLAHADAAHSSSARQRRSRNFFDSAVEYSRTDSPKKKR
jgi:hypothetical protein